MRIAITGGTGFIGGHLARRLLAEGHQVVLLARRASGHSTSGKNAEFVSSELSDSTALIDAFRDCDAVAHCAGINREIGEQTYQKVHVAATTNVVKAAQEAGVKKLLLMS